VFFKGCYAAHPGELVDGGILIETLPIASLTRHGEDADFNLNLNARPGYRIYSYSLE